MVSPLVHFLQPAHHHLTNAANALGPAKPLFDELSLLMRDRIALTLGNGIWHGRIAPGFILRHMGRDFHPETDVHPSLIMLLARFALCITVRYRHHGIGHEAQGGCRSRCGP
jgi:hypothetical protein